MDRVTLKQIVYEALQKARKESWNYERPIPLWEHIPDHSESTSNIRRLYEMFFNMHFNSYYILGRHYQQLIIEADGKKYVALKPFTPAPPAPKPSKTPAKTDAPKAEKKMSLEEYKAWWADQREKAAQRAAEKGLYGEDYQSGDSKRIINLGSDSDVA